MEDLKQDNYLRHLRKRVELWRTTGLYSRGRKGAISTPAYGLAAQLVPSDNNLSFKLEVLLIAKDRDSGDTQRISG